MKELTTGYFGTRCEYKIRNFPKSLINPDLANQMLGLSKLRPTSLISLRSSPGNNKLI